MADRGRVTVQMGGGLGNQLFQYAAARRLALHNGVPLTIDHLSGFARDFYQRQYRLDHFNVRGDAIEPGASYASDWGRVRRRLRIWINGRRELAKRTYVVERDRWFDPRMLDLEVRRAIYLHGYWQDERYFEDIRDLLCNELTVRTPPGPRSIEVAEKIASVEAVCLHVRRLHGVPNTKNAKPLSTATQREHVDASYIPRAIDSIGQRVARPHFFVFADYPDWAREHVHTTHPIDFVTHNDADRDYEDFWLMVQCRHFIIANSTFSWWAAWLGTHSDKIVIAPKQAIGEALCSVPGSWILV